MTAVKRLIKKLHAWRVINGYGGTKWALPDADLQYLPEIAKNTPVRAISIFQDLANRNITEAMKQASEILPDMVKTDEYHAGLVLKKIADAANKIEKENKHDLSTRYLERIIELSQNLVPTMKDQATTRYLLQDLAKNTQDHPKIFAQVIEVAFKNLDDPDPFDVMFRTAENKKDKPENIRAFFKIATDAMIQTQEENPEKSVTILWRLKNTWKNDPEKFTDLTMICLTRGNEQILNSLIDHRNFNDVSRKILSNTFNEKSQPDKQKLRELIRTGIQTRIEKERKQSYDHHCSTCC